MISNPFPDSIRSGTNLPLSRSILILALSLSTKRDDTQIPSSLQIATHSPTTNNRTDRHRSAFRMRKELRPSDHMFEPHAFPRLSSTPQSVLAKIAPRDVRTVVLLLLLLLLLFVCKATYFPFLFQTSRAGRLAEVVCQTNQTSSPVSVKLVHHAHTTAGWCLGSLRSQDTGCERPTATPRVEPCFLSQSIIAIIIVIIIIIVILLAFYFSTHETPQLQPTTTSFRA